MQATIPVKTYRVAAKPDCGHALRIDGEGRNHTFHLEAQGGRSGFSRGADYRVAPRATGSSCLQGYCLGYQFAPADNLRQGL